MKAGSHQNIVRNLYPESRNGLVKILRDTERYSEPLVPRHDVFVL